MSKGRTLSDLCVEGDILRECLVDIGKPEGWCRREMMWAWREWAASSGVLEPVGFLTASAEHERAELALEGASRAAEMWKRPVRGIRACGVWGDRDGWSLERNLGGNCHFGVICILIIYRLFMSWESSPRK